MTDTPTDGQLLRAADHDPHAFRLLYERWANPLLAFCRLRGAVIADWRSGFVMGLVAPKVVLPQALSW